MNRANSDASSRNKFIGVLFAGLAALFLIISISTQVLADPSDAPANLVATAGDGEVSLTWDAPENDGGFPIIGYDVEYSVAEAEEWTPFARTDSALTSEIVDGLVNSTTYDFRVVAVNENDEYSDPSVTTATPLSPLAGAPLNLTATAGAGQASLQWDVPSYTGTTAITDYVVEYRESGGGSWQTFADGISTEALATVSGLSNGTNYDFRVAAINSGGTGEYSDTASATPFTRPDAPVIGTATRGNGQATVSFTPPASNGGSEITVYTVNSSAGGFTSTGTASPITVTGLANGTSYTFTVIATNAAGDSSPSAASNAVTPATVPGVPTGLAATAASTQVGLSWVAPADNGGSAVTDYAIQYKLATDSTWNTYSDGVSTVTTANIEGLVNGSEYNFRVAAVTSVGTGDYSDSVSSTPHTTPGASTNLVATPGNSEVGLSWSAPSSNGGATITDYVVEYSTSGEGDWQVFPDGTSTTTSVTVTGLDNGTSYDFRIAAVNIAGQGVFSSSVESTPYTVPNAPTSVSASRGDKQATVSFTAPAFNGGSVITEYTVTSSPGGLTASGTSSPLVVTGLENGVSYTFTVVAKNAAGDGAISSPSSPVVPGAVSSAPLSPAATPANGQVGLSWTAPEDDGGSAITDYVIDYKLTSGSEWTTVSDGVSTGTSATVTGLSNGTSYDFRVSAVNEFGPGVYSVVVAATPRTTPGVPSGLVATPGDAQVALSWIAPSNGGSAITDYVVEYKLSSGSDWEELGNGVSTATTATIEGLDNGSSYDFRVAAVNVAGAGTSSGSVTSTPFTIPDAPVIGTAARGDGQATVTFTAPANNGGSDITGYTVLASSGGVSANGAGSPITVSGLTNGTAYTFTVIAINAAGDSLPSAASNSVTPATVPGTPAVTSATAGDGQVTIEFTPPASNGGSEITGYTVTSSPGNFTETSSDVSPVTINGLQNGVAYTFTVTATNDVGAGASSAPSSSVTPYTVPNPPTAVTAVRGDGQAVVSFSAPDFNGGSEITGYTVTSSVGDFTASGSASPITVNGLSNGTSYTFTVIATNAAGDSLSSEASNSVTPGAVPGIPTGLAATPGSAEVSLSWTAPANDGGSSIIDYIVEYKLTSDSTWTTFSDGVSSSTSATVVGLTNGSSYDFRVAAVNESVGAGPSAPAVSSIPMTAPGAPTGLVASPDNAEVELSWSAPAGNGGSVITDYVVEYKLASDSTWTTFSDGVSANTFLTVTGLVNGSSYDFRVAAVNAAGAGVYSATVSSTPDLTYPVISDITVNKTEEDFSTVSISWVTDIPANSQVEYGQGGIFDSSSPVANINGVTEHLVTIASLEACTTYNFRVASESLIDGGRAVSDSATFKTTDCPEQPEEGEEEGADKPGVDGADKDEGKGTSTPVGGPTGVTGGDDSSGDGVSEGDEDDDSDLSLPGDDEQGPVDEGQADADSTDDTSDDEGSDWTVAIWVAAGVVGVGAVVGIAAAGRRTEQ